MNEIAGFIAGALSLALIAGLVMVVLRATVFRRGRIRWVGWAPTWEVGGQPDVPEELQVERRDRAGKRSNYR